MSSIGENALVRNLHYLSESQAVTTNNLANVSSNGFKRRIAMPVETGTRFDDFLGAATTVAEFGQSMDWSAGSLLNTDDPGNIAFRDQNLFLRVQTKDGRIAYTRTGDLVLGTDNRLLTRTGDTVLDDNDQPIVLPSGTDQGAISLETIKIAPNGQLDLADGGTIGRLGLYEIQGGRGLTPVGGGNYVLPTGQQPRPAQTNGVLQRFLEQSNVEVMGQMVQMISNQRGFQATASALTTLGRIKESYVSAFNR